MLTSFDAFHRVGWQPDMAQAMAITRLQHLLNALQSDLKVPPKGLWLYGPPGRGKSALLEMFMAQIPSGLTRRRVHFHAFMSEIHARFYALETPPGKDPMAVLAAQIAEQAQVLGFDEFYVTNIADAMLLGRLMQALMRAGVVVVATSNWDMPDLFQGGLNRDRFLPFLKLMQMNLEPVDLRTGPDWRLSGVADNRNVGQYVLLRPGESSEAQLDVLLYEFGVGGMSPNLDAFNFKKCRGRAAWLTFGEACDTPHSRADYAALATGFDTIILEGIPQLTAKEADAALRLVMLVDIMYEHNRRLVVSAAVPPLEICVAGDAAKVFERTASRLVQMTGFVG